MERLQELFRTQFAERVRRLTELPADAPDSVGFYPLGNSDSEFFWVSLRTGETRIGSMKERPETLFSGNPGVFMLLFSGKLDFARAVSEGLLRTESPAHEVRALEQVFRRR